MPGVFTVGAHVRGKWVCAQCETLIQAPVAAQIIDKGIPTAGLLAQVLVAKYADHLPLYRQEGIFARAGFAIPRSTLGSWVGQCGWQLQPLVEALKAELLTHPVLHADETPVAMLKPGNGKTHRAYLWSYCTAIFCPVKAVVFDFADSRAGQHARDFLRVQSPSGWRGSLVCDTSAATRPRAGHQGRRLMAQRCASSMSSTTAPVGEQALKFFARLYEVARGARPPARGAKAHPAGLVVADALHQWLVEQWQQVPVLTARRLRRGRFDPPPARWKLPFAATLLPTT